MTTTQQSPVSNGVNVQALLDARAALSDAPEGAKFTWRATNKWAGGTHSQSTVEEFYGLGADQTHKSTFNFSADHPEVFASEDHGATPVEFVLVGLASCLTAGVAAVAQNREIQLNSVKATIEGDMDILGILDASQQEIEAIVAQSQKRSAVFDVITNPTNVSVTVN
jgi:organic hydroperoxide reductase OsmC/OhrA